MSTAEAPKPKRGPKGISPKVKGETAARVEAGLVTQAQAARELNVEPSTIQGWRRRLAAPHTHRTQDLKAAAQTAEAVLADIQADQLRVRQSLIAELRKRLGADEIASISAPQLMVMYGIVTDKDHNQQKLMAAAQAEGRAAGDPHAMDREQLAAQREAIRARRRGLEVIEGTATEVED